LEAVAPMLRTASITAAPLGTRARRLESSEED
jgi:hypothetical protein